MMEGADKILYVISELVGNYGRESYYIKCKQNTWALVPRILSINCC